MPRLQDYQVVSKTLTWQIFSMLKTMSHFGSNFLSPPLGNLTPIWVSLEDGGGVTKGRDWQVVCANEASLCWQAVTEGWHFYIAFIMLNVSYKCHFSSSGSNFSLTSAFWLFESCCLQWWSIQHEWWGDFNMRTLWELSHSIFVDVEGNFPFGHFRKIAEVVYLVV